ncbi:hypothetical protein U27_03419 [Candidatus Vecturithrix granuli]|uniref:Thioester domain-containing protein n=1 Tax=Vecturithrix granuli TaxID=1499967 RepID=A0A081BVV2_VECG1|nr:hypothetical protein U27_03419 [Candidatus Vecturithrix granuli]
MKIFAKIVVLFVVCSVIMPAATHAVSLVGTKHVESSVPYTRQVTGVRGGTAYESRPGGYPTQLRGDDGQLINDGKWMMAFCVEPGIKAHDGKEGELPVEAVAPEQKKGGLQAAWLMDMFYDDAHDENHLAALQMAIWEVVTDSTYDLAAGDFKIWDGNQAALDLAASYLAQVPSEFTPEQLACLNRMYQWISHPDKQDFIVTRGNACSEAQPITTQSVALVETKHLASSVPYMRQVKGVRGGVAYESRPGGYPTKLRCEGRQLLNDGKWMMTFCVEPGVKAHDGKDGELSVKLVDPEQKKGGLQAAWLFDMFYDDAHDENHLAAVQMAIWEVIVDPAGPYDLTTGDFKISEGDPAAIELAKSYLAQVPAQFDPARVTCLNNTYRVITHPKRQDLIIQWNTCGNDSCQ